MPKTASYATVEFPDRVWAMGFDVSPDEKMVVTTGSPVHLTGSVVLRDTNVGKCLRELPLPNGKSSNTARFTDDGRRIAVSSGKAIIVLDGSTLERQTELTSPGDMVLSLGWSADGSQLAAGAFWGQVALWEVAGREPVASVKLDTQILLVVILTDDRSRRIVVGTKSDLLVWTPATGGITSLLKLPTGWLSKSPNWNYTVARDRSTIIAVSDRGDICLIDTTDGGCRQLGIGLKKSVESVSVSRNLQIVAVGYASGQSAIFNVPDQRIVFRHREEHMDHVEVAALDDGARLLCIYDHKDLVIRDFRPKAVERLRSTQPIPDGHVHCVRMSGSDKRMDQRGNFDVPVNPLPTQCEKCRFPNPDFVAQPYLLAKHVSQPVDMALAEAGNFFVRPRLKEVLALTIPGQLSFYETMEANSEQTTPWFLAVPNAVVRVNEVISKVARCDACGEPLSAHPGSQYVGGWTEEGLFAHDVFKSQNWWGSRGGSGITFDRFLYFSVRLETLLKRLQFRGLTRSVDCKQKATADDDQWIETQLARIADTPVTESNDQPGLESV